MIINTNIQALVTTNSLWHRNNDLAKTAEKLSLGTKINKSGDDPAGLSIANKMRMQIKGLELADRNVNDAISVIQTAEGGVQEIENIVQRMRELAVQGANGTLSDDDRKLIHQEVAQLVTEIDSISDRMEFNKKRLLNDHYEEFTFQIGTGTGDEVSLSLKKINSEVLGISLEEGRHFDNNGNLIDPQPQERVPALDYTTREGADAAISRCDVAIDRINIYRTNLGAMQNRLEKTDTILDTSQENTKFALSRVVDTDMAGEMAEYTKNNVLVQAGISMLSQANQRPNQLLSLLQ